MSIRKSLFAAMLSFAGMIQAADLVEGVPAPAFEAKDQHGKVVRLADYLGKANVVLYFYPKDDTPGCTSQACSLRDGYGAIQQTGAVVLGVSSDDVASHQAFATKFSLPFSLLADPGKAIIEAYGVKMPVVGMAKRVTFIIDRKGIIRTILRQIDTKKHDQQVLEVLGGLK